MFSLQYVGFVVFIIWPSGSIYNSIPGPGIIFYNCITTQFRTNTFCVGTC
jgi:hypothetical protein